MEPNNIISSLEANGNLFEQLFSVVEQDERNWREAEGKWNILEVLCHLYDEEQFDFRARVKHALDPSLGNPPPIDPDGWVKEKNYASWHYEETLQKLIVERRKSVEWLQALQNPDWDSCWQHPHWGPMSARLFLSNWLAHDYLHIRQIMRIRHAYLSANAGVDMRYAGEW